MLINRAYIAFFALFSFNAQDADITFAIMVVVVFLYRLGVRTQPKGRLRVDMTCMSSL